MTAKEQLAAAWRGAEKLARALTKVGAKSEQPDFIQRRQGKTDIWDGAPQSPLAGENPSFSAARTKDRLEYFLFALPRKSVSALFN